MRIMTIYGTRPEAIKVAPIIKAIEADSELHNIVVVTGQHREMLDQVNLIFEISPDYDLNIMSMGQSLNAIVSRVIKGVDGILEVEEPDAVIVQGDTSSVMAAAVASFNRRIPVIHLEAGLRSGDINSPFPEEANRRLTTQIALLHLAPTETSKANLTRENVASEDIVVTGNSVIDALMFTNEHSGTHFQDKGLERLAGARMGEGGARILLVTAHRRENIGPSMDSIGLAIADLATKYPDLVVVFPIHKNPVVRASIKPAIEGLDNVLLIEPLSYAEFTRLLSIADLVLTDSGGVQEEAPSLGKPVLVMRDNTERPEAVLAGTVKLVGTNRQRVVDEVSSLLDSEASYRAMANAVNPYGDGAAARRTVEAIKWKFGSGERPVDF